MADSKVEQKAPIFHCVQYFMPPQITENHFRVAKNLHRILEDKVLRNTYAVCVLLMIIEQIL